MKSLEYWWYTVQGPAVRQTPAAGQGLDRSTGGGSGTPGEDANRAKSMQAAHCQKLKRGLQRSESFSSGEGSEESGEESDKAIRAGTSKRDPAEGVATKQVRETHVCP